MSDHLKISPQGKITDNAYRDIGQIAWSIPFPRDVSDFIWYRDQSEADTVIEGLKDEIAGCEETCGALEYEVSVLEEDLDDAKETLSEIQTKLAALLNADDLGESQAKVIKEILEELL